ncbi:MAG: hypothetical protein QF440_06685 [Candidatus Thalassarchaeaceae archaeon]|nr:hypothetical protein [Candidatus Thalassarchaeaceae archaeon]
MLPGAWWFLLAMCSILGVATWYLRNFTEHDNAVKLTAYSGIACMLALVFWTFTLDV